jgi:hypothetical protein
MTSAYRQECKKNINIVLTYRQECKKNINCYQYVERNVIKILTVISI